MTLRVGEKVNTPVLDRKSTSSAHLFREGFLSCCANNNGVIVAIVIISVK